MLKTLEQKVRYCLREFPDTRNDDRRLIGTVYQHFYHVDPYEPLGNVLFDYCLPSFESIGRARRKIQEKDESLRGDAESEKKRMEAQQMYIEYALSDK